MKKLFSLESLLVATIISLSLPLITFNCSAQPQRSLTIFRTSNPSSSSRGDQLHVTLRSQEGLERFVFSANDRTNATNSESTEWHYQGFARPRNFRHTPRASAISITPTKTWIFFTSRRTGRPVAASLSTISNPRSGKHTKRLRISRAPRQRMPCGSTATDEAHLSAGTPSTSARQRGRSTPSLHSTDAAKILSPARIVEVATAADYSFFQIHGEQTNSYIRAILNATNALYSSTLGIRLKITSQRVDRNSANASGTTTAINLLEEFRQSQFASSSSADVRHLFTGRSIDGLTIGIAYIGSVCTAGGRYAVGLSASVNPALQPLLAAHEIGHNLSAVHDSEPQSIMNPAITEANNRFSGGAAANVISFVNTSGSCLAQETASKVSLDLDLSDPKRFIANVTFSTANASQCNVSLLGSSNARRYIPVGTSAYKAAGAGLSNSVKFDAKTPPLTTSQKFFFKTKVTCETPKTEVTSQAAILRYGFASSSRSPSSRESERWLAALRQSLRTN